MTDIARRLSEEMREERQAQLSMINTGCGFSVRERFEWNALHDLYVADLEIAEWKGNYEAVSGCHASCEKDLEEAHATISEQSATIEAMRETIRVVANQGNPECGCYVMLGSLLAQGDDQLAATHDERIMAEGGAIALEKAARLLDGDSYYKQAAEMVRAMASEIREKNKIG